MNELFEFRKHLNTKKVVFFVIILIVILGLLLAFLFKNNESNFNQEDDTKPYKTYTSSDGKISLELPKRYNLNIEKSDYILKLQSNDGLVINIEENTIVFGKSLKEIANIDKGNYISKFENAFEVSDLKEFSLENNNSLSSYTYNFKHINQGLEYYIQVFWMQDNAKYYTISLCIPQNNSSKFQGIESEIISSFKIN